ncbi:anther-specific proline-rich protein APG-like [Lytechinus variegatus]|uniref:anther-specific proline-rich protein APG-like n=1 Tax=Lytechinus variegatus TaxID=7654 RepID=UPI001BB1FA76|nr:anther-specific proline-rich protein APG-like [Lytechinus variegatus]
MSGKLLLQCLQQSLEKQQLQDKIASLASQLGVGPDGDSADLLAKINSLVTESEGRRLQAEKKAKAFQDRFLDSATEVQVLKMELAEARKQRDAALKNLQDLTWNPVESSSPVTEPPIRGSWYCEGNPQSLSSAPPGLGVEPTSTPSTAPYTQSTPATAPYNQSTPVTAPYNPPTPDTAPYNPPTPDTAPYNPPTPDTAPYNPPTPDTAPYNPPTPETAPIDTIPPPLVPPRPSPQASGSEAAVGTPPTVSLSAQASEVVHHHTPTTASQSTSVSTGVGRATAPLSSSAAAAPVPASSFVQGMGDLKSFHQGGGNIFLGSGANGTVHLYRHHVTDQPIALKTFELPNDIDGMTKKVKVIQSEAFILDVLGREECFPTFLGCLEISPGTIGLAMEFIGDTATGETWTLSRGMRELVLSQQEWFSLALDIAKSLGIIHEKGYLMNDLKEDNCLLRKSPSGQWQAVIVDFGLACSRTEPFSYSFSTEDKEKYQRREIYVHIAPECALDDHPISVSSDVFQLGRLLTMMGDSTNNGDLTAIGNICRQSSHLCRPTIDEVVDELERVM